MFYCDKILLYGVIIFWGERAETGKCSIHTAHNLIGTCSQYEGLVLLGECMFYFFAFFPPSDAGEQRDLINMIDLAIDNSEATRIRLRDVSENIPWPVVTVVLFIFCLIPTIKFGKRSHMVVHHQPISHATRITACRQLATKRRPNKRKSEN